ncbi:hypothetical protein GCM10023166_08080 [Paeniglutamicibacter cryotolerans]
MPRANLVERALPFLPVGSEIRQAFIAQAAPSFFYFIVTYLTGLMFGNEYRCVVVTPEAIYVLDSSKWSGGAKPQALAGQMTRNTRLGPVSGRWAEVRLLGKRHWVHKRFHEQIAAADREAGLEYDTGSRPRARFFRDPDRCPAGTRRTRRSVR